MLKLMLLFNCSYFLYFVFLFLGSQAKDCCRYCYYYYSDVKVDKEWKDVPRCKECKRNWSTIKVSLSVLDEVIYVSILLFCE